MEGASPTVDKNRVLDVKPLRTLVPVFPSSSQAPPFMSAPPFGPTPAGSSPFYPFAAPQSTPDLNQHTPPPNPAPLRSYRAPQTNGNVIDVEAGPFRTGTGKRRPGRPRKTGASSSQKKPREQQESRDLDSTFSPISDKFVLGISPAQKDDGDRDLVLSILTRLDAVRRKLNQLDGGRGNSKAVNVMITKGIRTNVRKRTGVVPGIEVGDIFFFRLEMILVGLHSQSMAGIDYLLTKNDMVEEPLAVSIVASGGYDDDAEDPDVLLYTGQGGNANSKVKPASDQKLVRGNLALERSLRRGNEVRVVRGINYNLNLVTKFYMYDGLYVIQESWVEKGKSGCNIFKYKLLRVPGQPAAFANWKSIERWRENMSSRAGLILPDLTSGAESIPVSLVNEVDEVKGPAYFTYIPSVKNDKAFKLTVPSFTCNCRNMCKPGDPSCPCMDGNGGNFPYTSEVVLVSRRPMIYECGPSCPCIPNCNNRVSQTGLKVRLEVFKTKDRGWGLRSLDPIRCGTFICEYAGELIDKAMAGEEAEHDDYIFDTSRIYQSFRWNCEPGILVDAESDAAEEYNIPSPVVISARDGGNVSRFMNHSCSPNVFWQPIMYEDNNMPSLHIAFFALRHIPPLTELTYDYGISRKVEADGDSVPPPRGKKKCSCGTPKCRGYFG